MKHFELKGTLRTEFGKKAAKQIKKAKNIPCVIYGIGETTHFTISNADVRNLIYTPSVMFVDLDIEGKKEIALVKDIQFDPVSDAIIHIDFYQVNPEKPVKVCIPLKLIGNSEGVKAGGKLSQNIKRIAIKGMMENIPDLYEVSIDNLQLGGTIRVKDLKSETLEFTNPQNAIIASVMLSRGATADDTAATTEAPAAE